MKLSECVSILVFSQIYSYVCLGVVQSGMYLEFVNTRVIKHDVETYFALHMKYFIFFLLIYLNMVHFINTLYTTGTRIFIKQ